MGVRRDHVGNSHSGDDTLPWSPEPRDIRVPPPWEQAEAAGGLPGRAVSELHCHWAPARPAAGSAEAWGHTAAGAGDTLSQAGMCGRVQRRGTHRLAGQSLYSCGRWCMHMCSRPVHLQVQAPLGNADGLAVHRAPERCLPSRATSPFSF